MAGALTGAVPTIRWSDQDNIKNSETWNKDSKLWNKTYDNCRDTERSVPAKNDLKLYLNY